MTYTIRKMDYKDLQSVQRVAKISWNATYEGIIPLQIQTNFLEEAYSDEKMKLRLERSIVYVAQIAGEIVGFANYSNVRQGGKVELAAIYLYPEVQGQGIGSALLQIAKDELDGIKEIYMNVEEENTIGRNFYEAKGFTVIDQFEELFDGHLLKNIRMVLVVQ